MRLFINMYLLPISLVISAYLLVTNGYEFSDNRYIGDVAVGAVFVGKGFALVAMLLAATRTWKAWRAYAGKGDLCDRCGGPAEHRPNGRYGPYFKC